MRTDDGTWHCQRGPQPARFGRAGTRPLLDRRSGDDTTPAGVFPLGVVTAWDGQTFSIFGNQPDPGVLAPYRSVRYEDCWGAVKNTARYQHLVNRPGCTGPDEWLRKIGDVYAHAAVIGANLDPISGDAPGETPYAAAIFLHRHSYSSSGAPQATSGCVSLAIADLVDTLRLLDPRLAPALRDRPDGLVAQTPPEPRHAAGRLAFRACRPTSSLQRCSLPVNSNCATTRIPISSSQARCCCGCWRRASAAPTSTHSAARPSSTPAPTTPRRRRSRSSRATRTSASWRRSATAERPRSTARRWRSATASCRHPTAPAVSASTAAATSRTTSAAGSRTTATR